MIVALESLILATTFLFFKIALAIQRLLCFHRNLRNKQTNKKTIYSSVENAIDNLIGIALNLLIAFGSIVVLNGLSLPIQEHGISLHMFVLSLISFISVFQFWSTDILPP